MYKPTTFRQRGVPKCQFSQYARHQAITLQYKIHKMRVFEVTKDNIGVAVPIIHANALTLSMLRVYHANGCADQFVYLAAGNCINLQHFSINMLWVTRSCRQGALAQLAHRLETLNIVHATADDFIDCYNGSIRKLFSKDNIVFERDPMNEKLSINLEEYNITDAVRMFGVTRCPHFIAQISPRQSFVLPTGFVVAEMYSPTHLRIAPKMGPAMSTSLYVGQSRIPAIPPGPISVNMYAITQHALCVLAGYERSIVHIMIAVAPRPEDNAMVTAFLARCPLLDPTTIQISGSPRGVESVQLPTVRVGRGWV